MFLQVLVQALILVTNRFMLNNGSTIPVVAGRCSIVFIVDLEQVFTYS